MAQGEPRRWTLKRTHPMSSMLDGPKLKLGESVPVIEAVLTDSLLEDTARAIYEERSRHSVVAAPWEHLGEALGGSKWHTRIEAHAALEAAGFRGDRNPDRAK